jgi:methyl-accepting chemotaxis protein
MYVANNGDTVDARESSFESVQDTGSRQDQLQILIQGLDAVSLPMHLIDTDYRITFINRAAADLLGMKKEQAIGKKCYDLYKTANCNTRECPCRVAMEGNTTYRCDNSCGDLLIDCTGAPLKDEYGEIVGAIEYFPDVTGQKTAVKDILRVAGEAEKGNLAVRTDLALHEGDFLEMAKGINAILDAVVGPLSIAAGHVDRISKGDIPEKITKGYHGDFKLIIDNLNACIDGLSGLKEANAVLQKLSVNDYTKKVDGNYQGIFAGIAAATNAVVDHNIYVQKTVVEISQGNLERLENYRKVGRRSENDHFLPAFIDMMQNIQFLVDDTKMLAEAGVNGQLKTRADASRHRGAYREVVEGVNATLDAVVGPLNIAADFISDVAVGNELKKITDDLPGDYARIKDSINKCHGVLYGLLGEIGMLTEAAVNGRLDSRGNVENFEGAWIQIVGGINDMMNAVVVPLNEAMRVSEAYANGNFGACVDEKIQVAGDFLKFMEALNNIGVQISAAVGEVNRAVMQMDFGTTEASKGSEEIAKAAEQVAQTSQKCADLSRQVLDQMEDIDRQLADLSAANEEIASTSHDVLDRARRAAEQGAKAEKLGKDTNVKMAAVEKIAQESVVEIEGLNAQMREINNIVRLITDIANQVNLLALNAAIEAARAGEHGRGFAVVAGEVRNLAGEAKSATGHIEKVIDGIQASSEKTAAAIKSANAEIEVGVESVNNAIEALTTIIAETESVAHGIGEIARATEDQANSTNKVVQGVAEGNRLTKETQGQMDDLAALAEEASASTEEIGSAVHELSEMAGHLKKNMQQFRT